MLKFMTSGGRGEGEGNGEDSEDAPAVMKGKSDDGITIRVSSFYVKYNIMFEFQFIG